MRSDDAVETFKRHAENEESAAHGSHEYYANAESTMPVLIRKHVNASDHVEVSAQPCKFTWQ